MASDRRVAPEPAAPACQAPGDGEQAQPQAPGLPAAAGGAGQGEHLGPGQQLAGQRDDLAPFLLSLRGTSCDVTMGSGCPLTPPTPDHVLAKLSPGHQKPGASARAGSPPITGRRS